MVIISTDRSSLSSLTQNKYLEKGRMFLLQSGLSTDLFIFLTGFLWCV